MKFLHKSRNLLLRGLLKTLKTIGLSESFNYFFKYKFDSNSKTLKIPIQGETGRIYTYLPIITWKFYLFNQLKKYLGNDVLCIDIGANLGQTLLESSLVWTDSQHILFEPSSECVAYINKIIQENGIKATVLPIALSNENKLGLLEAFNDVDPTASLIGSEMRPLHQQSSRVVSCFTLDYVSQNLSEIFAIKKTTLVKIDVEHYELEVILGMQNFISSVRPVIICEILYADQNANLQAVQERSDKLISIMRNLNYRIYRISLDESQQSFLGLIEIETTIMTKYYSGDNFYQCDYLLVPIENREIEDFCKKYSTTATTVGA